MNKEVMIPIYRAKRLDNDEYVEGFYYERPYLGKMIPLLDVDLDEYEIDPSTLAIHFPDMLDKNNKPIFASLSEDGEGGDTFVYSETIKPCCKKEIAVAVYREYSIFLMSDEGEYSFFDCNDKEKIWFEATGIYEGETDDTK